MMKKLLYFTVCLMLCSCGDFLKEQSKELVYAQSCEDLKEILIGNAYMNCMAHESFSDVNQGSYSWLFVMDDDIEEHATGSFNPPSTFSFALRPFYTWAQRPFVNKLGNSVEDQTWQKLYKYISHVNLIIAQVAKFPDDPVELRNQVIGEARFLRAAYYFLLTNIYAKPYVEATADEDLSVALKLTEYVEDKYYSRHTIREVYHQIVEDLKAAADDLSQIEQKTVFRGSELAARTLLSRVYLYMGKWELAIEECDRVLAIGAPLWDLNTFNFTETSSGAGPVKLKYALSLESPEVLFTQGSNEMHCMMSDFTGNKGRYCVSSELGDLFDKYNDEGVSDLRKKGYFSLSKDEKLWCRKNPIEPSHIRVFDSYVLRTAEIYLNKAEAEAMLDRPNAKETIKMLLENRFKDQQIPDLSQLSGEALVKFIREERRRELCFEVHRWFDLRRYAVSPKYAETKEIVHVVYAPGTEEGAPALYDGMYILKQYGEEPAYLLPIPDLEIEFNQGFFKQNELREERLKN